MSDAMVVFLIVAGVLALWYAVLIPVMKRSGGLSAKTASSRRARSDDATQDVAAATAVALSGVDASRH